jgi:hypothetical protein
MWDCTDSQEVGLEAATLKRVRNSSLVEWSCADNVTGLKPRAEAADFRDYTGVVGERRACSEVAAQAVVERARERMPA